MRRFVSILIVLILVVAALGLPAAGRQSHKLAPAPGQSLTVSARVGEVSRLDGEIWVKRRGGAEPQALQPGDTLVEGDVLTTGQQGRAEWTMRPGSYFQIGQNSRVRVDRMSGGSMRFGVERGEVFVIVGILDHVGELELDTPHALLTVAKRGSYKIRVAPNDDTAATVVRGELRFVNRKGEAGRVTRHKQVRFFEKAG